MRKKMAQGYLVWSFFKCVYRSLFLTTKLFLKFEPLIVFKLNKLMDAKGKNPAPGDYESSSKILFSSCPFKDVPVLKNSTIYIM